MATTSAGTPYVEATDTASDYPTTSLALANRVDAVEDKVLHSGLYLSGATGNYPTAPDAAGLDITGSIEIVGNLKLTDYTPAANSTWLAKYSTAGQNSYATDFTTAGLMRLIWSADGSAGIVASSTVAPTVTNGTAYWFKVTRDSTTGDVKFWQAADAANEPTSWTQVGTTVAAATGAMFSGTHVLAVGSRSDGSQPITGTVYRVIVRSGIGGTVAASPDFRLPFDGRHRDTAGNNWTLTGSAWAWVTEEA